MDFSQNQYDQEDSEFDPRSDGNASRDGFDSDGSRVHHKSKKKGGADGLGAYNMLKILNTVLYISTLQMSLIYFNNTKFTSKFVYYAFLGLLTMRPCLIGLYSLINICLEMRKGAPGGKKTKGKKAKKKSGSMDDFSDSQRSQPDESYGDEYGDENDPYGQSGYQD